MGATFAEILPFALGIAVSPIPIIAVIPLLFSPRARSLGAAFALGWALGIAAVAVVFALLGGLIDEDREGGRPIAGAIRILLGILLLALAVQQWRKRPREGEEAELPGWMRAMDRLSPAQAFGIAALLGSVNPKNLILGASAGVGIAAAGAGGASLVDLGELLLDYVVVASITVTAIVAVVWIAPRRVAEPLARLRAWLERFHAHIMTVLLILLGIASIVQGIGAF